ncbi:uncharacterized protein LOC143889622 [Tasmannia lanceolata]|uniref:uncharacterized protein LOC143889622 n=1 Tax=Tasmannia lanceolata TaxID=3420 RepID=UPI004062BC39
MLVELLMNLLTNLGHVESLELGLFGYITESLRRMKLPKSLPELKLKKLTLGVDSDVAIFLSCLLRSCPNLQELSIEGFQEQKEFVEENYWERQGPSECSMHHLTTVRINMDCLCNCFGIGFMEFLLKNAYALKRMSIIYHSSLKKKLEAEIRRARGERVRSRKVLGEIGTF